ncbi:indoleamine 2,3-dioxygenase 1-like [Pecten maximus]|uniref:indoleamine 2,3-dioxygenase 1-like n=1 Tax=Pecten maximus TaxID=6579 RepID=UPI001457EF1B|nr:indoleamine 2,3-dioxygenase 1-like [Pecten maximus]
MAEVMTNLSLKQIEEKFLVSTKTGFLIDCSMVKFPECWSPFEEIAAHLKQYVEEKSIRRKIEELNGHLCIPEDKLQQLCLHKILTFLTSGYVWQDGENDVPKRLPRCVAVPLTRVSDALGMKPILSYPSMILANWQKKDMNGPFDFSNLNAMYQTPGGNGAEWFILTHVIIEQRFAPAIKAVIDAMKYSTEGQADDAALVTALNVIPNVLSEMCETFKKINGGVEPAHFYDNLRIFYTGWGGGKEPLPEGLIYEGVYEDVPKPMKGGSAAQSTTLQVLDAALGIEHEGEEKEFLDEVRDYMLKEHSDFCKYMRNESSVRNYVEHCENLDVKMAYNKCINAIQSFRKLHIHKVVQYVTTPSRRENRNMQVEAIRETGTGSTPYLQFLNQINKDTDACILPE